MTPVVTVDTREFQSAMRQYMAVTKRTLEDATNRRMFFILTRAFVLMKPHNAQAERDRIRDYMNTQIGERRMDKRTGKMIGKKRILRRVHLIAQSLNKKAGNKGLYGADMRKAAGKLRSRAVGSVGYLKSVIAKAIKQINGHFTQFGFSTKKASGKQISGNATAIKFAAEYGTSQANVGMHKGGRAYVLPARAGFSPQAIADMATGIANGQESRVENEYNSAFSRAYRDETAELNRHLAERMQSDINRFTAQKA